MSEDTWMCRRCIKEWKQSSSSQIHLTNIKYTSESSTFLPVGFVCNLWLLTDLYSVYSVHLCLMSDCPHCCPIKGLSSIFIEQCKKKTAWKKDESHFIAILNRERQRCLTDRIASTIKGSCGAALNTVSNLYDRHLSYKAASNMLAPFSKWSPQHTHTLFCIRDREGYMI